MKIKNEKGNGVDRKDKEQLLWISLPLSYFKVRMWSFGVI